MRPQRDPENGDSYLGVAALRSASFRRELRHFGIDPDLFEQCLDGKLSEMQHAQRELCSHLIDAVAIPAAGHAVANKHVISRSLVGFLITAMLDAMQRKADQLTDYDPQEIGLVDGLAELIKSQLVIGNGEHVHMQKHEEDRSRAILITQSMIEAGVTPTIRKVAEKMGTAPSTISRMFAGESLLEETRKRFKAIEDHKASLRT